MDVLELISRSEWPAVTVGAIWLIRQPLQRMIDRINPTKLDAWGLKAEFQERLQKAEYLVSTSHQPALGPGSTRRSKLELSLYKNPETRILRAWRKLADAIQMAAETTRSGKAQTGIVWEYHDIVLDAADRIPLKDDEIAAIATLGALRNQVARGESGGITDKEADQFEDIVRKLRLSLQEEAAA